MTDEIQNSHSLFDQIINKEKSNLCVTKRIKEKKTLIRTIIKAKFPLKQLKTKPLAIEKLERGILFGNGNKNEKDIS